MSGQELREALSGISSDGSLKNNIVKDRAEYNPGSNVVGIYFATSAHLSPARFLKLKKRLQGYARDGMSLKLTQAKYAVEIQHNAAEMEKVCKDFCILKQPAIAPFIEKAHIELQNTTLHITFAEEMGKEMFLSMSLADLLEDYLKDAYGLELQILLAVDAEKQGEYTVSEEVTGVIQKQAEKKMEMPHPKPQAQPTYRKNATTEQTTEFVTAISELREGEKITIEGEVVAVESRPIKDGEYTKHKFVVYDYTASVTCFFIEGQRFKNNLTLPEKGKWVKVDGTYDVDNFDKDSTIKVRAIRPSQKGLRLDTAEEKRVELHVHTQMSAQDAVSPAKDIIARAAKWGMKAVAITDHGVVQAFPEASGAAKKTGIKVIYGVEAYMIDDTRGAYEGGDNRDFGGEYVVFDIETTGLSKNADDITEIGAVRVVDGQLRDKFHTFVKPRNPIPPAIVSLTGITDEMVADAPLPKEALQAFHAFVGQEAALVAHNAKFDTGFIFGKSAEFEIVYSNSVIDTLDLCRLAYPELKNHKLNTVAKHLRISLSHHRAINDAECTAKILLDCFAHFKKMGAADLDGLNGLFDLGATYKHSKMYHVILLCKNKCGLRNLYKLVSHAHIDYFYRKPRMPKSLIEAHREGLLIGSACEAGDIYTALLDGAPQAKLEKLAKFYDYLEIQPVGNNGFLVRNGTLGSENDIRDLNREVIALGERLGIPVCATCDVHFLDPHGEYFRRIIQKVQKYDDVTQPPLYMRTTGEMLEEFAYLGEEKAREVVITNPNQIADMVEEIELFQNDTAMPVLENAAEHLEEMAYINAKATYGDPLPEIVAARLKRELDSIIGHGFSVLYYSAHKLVKKSMEDGYLVGSRGSVGSSLAATMTGITEVNPLPPHYVCPNCKHSDFNIDKEQYACGPDLPDAVCPKCGTIYIKDGFDIPFEVFLGINADKVPDIDLNFSGEYQSVAHKYTEELFGEGHVFRAGTISAVQDRIAYGYVKKYFDETGQNASEAEINRLVEGVSGVKKTTGQHPGGMVIVPHDREVYEFTPVQRPADKMDAEFITTHFDFNSMHDILVKLDILGHDVPTIIRKLQDLTGIDPLQIPLDDKPTMDLFSSLKPLHLKPEQFGNMGIRTGTLGIPEFGTKFVRQMLMDTLPTTVGEIVRISGLSHGTDVWLGNAQELINHHICTLKEAICTRDDIMNYLVDKGVDKRQAFFIMEKVRKGQAAKKGFTDEENNAFSDANIPDWFKDSCLKIKYMFPKAHAVAYCIMSLRIAYCKVHHMAAFYSSYFSVKSGEFDASMVTDGLEGIKRNWQMIENKGKAATANEKNMQTMLEVACEMYLRGLHFLPVDLEKSDATEFLVEENGIRLPFISVPQLGANAALAIAQERVQNTFLSVEDLKKRCRISSAVIEEMGNMGTLTGLKQTNQLSLFDL